MATPSVQGTGTTSLPLAPLSSPTSSISWPTQESSTSVSSLAATQASNQGTGTPDSKPKKHKTRNAWISGVVIGAVALLAIIALAFHLIRTRNRNNKNLGQIPYQAAPTTSHIYGQPPQVYPNSPSIMATVPTELPNGYGDISPYPGYKGGFAMMGTVLAPGQGEQRPSQDMNGRTTWVSQDGTVASSEPGQTEISHTTQSISELPELVSTPGQSGARGRK
ncbi:hypothetical protein GQ43DRAFT_476983 [Delitschia confertaspora ATCC 74209]|uniref:Transmembrane protein n=1 Tax=Delitschia confertaspora ATCC 74209 TaxID=1513339 RepID=A0A9P4N035_9PLEO|nr:hypothetical protein GQ43DRAFT_476983 [Delitschia confertaspora ATCC 74209]